MYSVEAQVLRVDPSITYPASEMTFTEWSRLVTIPPMESDQEELQEARKVAALARSHYTEVRLTSSSHIGSKVVA